MGLWLSQMSLALQLVTILEKARRGGEPVLQTCWSVEVLHRSIPPDDKGQLLLMPGVVSGPHADVAPQILIGVYPDGDVHQHDVAPPHPYLLPHWQELLHHVVR